ncbi:hypothetical protein [uncultured Prevotella sp.]|nr:hypothetical protein [uncultured Prevotella sp.]
MKSEDMKGKAVSQEAKAVATGDMTTGSWPTYSSYLHSCGWYTD